jgi:hypothetical protein
MVMTNLFALYFSCIGREGVGRGGVGTHAATYLSAREPLEMPVDV